MCFRFELANLRQDPTFCFTSNVSVRYKQQGQHSRITSCSQRQNIGVVLSSVEGSKLVGVSRDDFQKTFDHDVDLARE